MNKYSNFLLSEIQPKKNIVDTHKTIFGVMRQISLSQSERSRDENMFEEYTSIEKMTVEKERKN